MGRRVLIAIGCLLMALGAMPASLRATIGVNVVNPQRLAAAERETVLDQLQAADVRVIRVPLEPQRDGADYGPSIDFIRRAFERGIKADVIVGLRYRKGAVQRAAFKNLPDMWPSYPLSAADPLRFRAAFEPLLRRLEGMGITLAALELGNEINWTAFNGEFPIPGEGRVFGSEDLARDPEAARIADGYRAYLRTLRVLKQIRDSSRRNRHTPILSAGLADPGPAGPHPGSITDAVSIGATLKYLRAGGMDALVDAYGVHTYPGAAADEAGRLAHDALAACEPPDHGKPCWLTEWGLRADSVACPGNDLPRAERIREMLGDLRPFVRSGRLTGLFYYAWADREYGIYRCGGLTESGRLAIDRGVFE